MIIVGRKYLLPLIVLERLRGERTLRRRLGTGEIFQAKHDQKLARHIGQEWRGGGFGRGIAGSGGEASGSCRDGEGAPSFRASLMPAIEPSRRRTTVAGIRIGPGCACSRSSGGDWPSGMKRKGMISSSPWEAAGDLLAGMSRLLTHFSFRRKPNLFPMPGSAADAA